MTTLDGTRNEARIVADTITAHAEIAMMPIVTRRVKVMVRDIYFFTKAPIGTHTT